MKNLIMIGGTMGVGKTSACVKLKKKLPNCVFLDGDWCWDADLFVVTDETKAMVMDNICHLLNNFIKSTAYENVVFCWVMHEQSIIDEILSKVCTENCKIHSISLICSKQALISRLLGDIEKGIRTADVIERSTARLAMYEKLDTVKIDVSELSIEQTAGKITDIVSKE